MTVPTLRAARRTTVRGDSTGGGADPRSPERWRWINLVLVQGTPDRLREVRSAGSEIDAVLAAHTGSLGTGLIQIAQSDPSGRVDTMALALKAGQVVKIAVDGEQDVVDEGIVLLNYRYDLPNRDGRFELTVFGCPSVRQCKSDTRGHVPSAPRFSDRGCCMSARWCEPVMLLSMGSSS